MNAARVGSAQLSALAARLSQRDLRVLGSIDEHRFLTTGQLQRLHFTAGAGHATALAGMRACVRSLDRLRHLRLITRLERRIGGLHAGSRAFVWCLDAVGERLLRRDTDAGEVRRRRVFEPTVLFLEHSLAVAELGVGLEEVARTGAIGLERVDTEPACWREFIGPHGTRVTLKPDLYAVTTSSDFEDYWFWEVDRGTESIRTVLAKCATYEAYRTTSREQATSGVFPLVVWVVLDEKRRGRIEGEIRSARNLDARLYRVVTAADAVGLVTGEPPPEDASMAEGAAGEPVPPGKPPPPLPVPEAPYPLTITP